MTIIGPAALGHLRDLRRRMMWAFGAVAVAMGVLWIFKEALLGLLLAPLLALRGHFVQVVYTGVPELFFIYLKICGWGGLFVALPFALWLAWGFLAPGLYAREKRFAAPLLAALPVLFYAGGAFAYALVVPTALAFFLGFEQEGVWAQPVLREYLSFVFSMMFAFGLAFNLPVALLLLVRAGWLSVAALRRYRRFVVVIILIVAAILTPPDPFSQLALAVPLYVLYELAIWAAGWLGAEKAEAV